MFHCYLFELLPHCMCSSFHVVLYMSSVSALMMMSFTSPIFGLIVALP